MKKIGIIMTLLFTSLFFVFLNNNVKANSNACVREVTYLIKDPNGSQYYLCNGEQVYLLGSSRSDSSFFHNGYREPFIYARDPHGNDSYYISSLYVHAVAHDGKKNDNKWIKIYYEGQEVYSNQFKDTIRDDSKKEYLPLYKEAGLYRIDQYVNNGVLDKSIKIHVYNEKLVNFTMLQANVDETVIFEGEQNFLINSTHNLNFEFEIDKSILGIHDQVIISVNDHLIEVYPRATDASYLVKLARNQFIEYLETNNSTDNPNIIIVRVRDFLNNEFEFIYELVIAEEKLEIQLKYLDEPGILNSKKVDINIIPGIGNTLVKGSTFYFISRDPSIPKTKEEFMNRHRASAESGAYENGSSIIIRNHNGNYYLFASAEDEDGFHVERSGAFKLEAEQFNTIEITPSSMLFTILIFTFALAPIVVYSIIKKQ